MDTQWNLDRDGLRSRVRIAVLEDNVLHRNMIARSLRDEGYDVITYDSTADLDPVRLRNYHILITNHSPATGMAHWTLAAVAPNPHCKVIVTSTHPSASEASEFRRLGAFDYLAKPFTEAQLARVVKRAAGLGEAEATGQNTFEELENDLNPSKPLVLLLGDIDHEGVLSILRTAGRQYKKKVLVSNPRNWESILEYFQKFEISAVVAKISAKVYDLLADDDYERVGDSLLEQISQVPHMVFVFEGLLSGDFSQEWANDFYQPPAVILDVVNYKLRNRGLNVLPYRRNAEVTVLAQTLLSDSEHGLIFRIYVPSGRIWANETDRLLQLFRDYLARVGHASVRLDQVRTERGIIYEFYGAEMAEEGRLAREFHDFSHLLDLSVANPDQAEALLKSKSVNPQDILDIVSRYSKEAKRLQVDLRHERERRLLSIRQRLESELVDAFPPNAPWSEIEQLAEAAVPSVRGIGSLLTDSHRSVLLSGITAQTLTINVNSQIIDAVNAVVAEEIQGSAHLTQQDQDLLSLIQQHGGDRAAELTSAVHELADPSAPKSGRLSAKQKLKAFLFHIGSKATDVGLGILQSYIEKKMLGL